MTGTSHGDAAVGFDPLRPKFRKVVKRGLHHPSSEAPVLRPLRPLAA